MIGTRVKDARKAAKLTQKSLAASALVTQGAISQLERGDTKEPNAEMVLRIARACRVSVFWLVFGEPYPRKTSMYSAEAAALARAYDELTETQQAELTGYLNYLLSREPTSNPLADLLKKIGQ